MNVIAQIVKFSNEFLQIGFHASQIAMGNAATAFVNNESALIYNPSKLSFLKNKTSFAFSHFDFFSLANFDQMIFSQIVTDTITIGLSLVRFNVDDIQNTIFLVDSNGNYDYSRISYFSTNDYALIGGLGKKISSNFSIGANCYFIFRKVGNFGWAMGFRFDIGATYTLNKWIFATILSNATTSPTLWFFNIDEKTKNILILTGNSVPINTIEISLPYITIGLARTFEFNNNTLSFDLDILMSLEGKQKSILKDFFVGLYPRLGAEYGINNTLFFRLGFNNLQFITTYKENSSNYFVEKLNIWPSAGIGLIYKNFSINYSLIYTNIFENSLSNFFTLSFKIK